jgi:hypothetical protein
MAIISPLKKIFNWQTASEKIPYKVYTALLTQTGTDAPIATVLQNTIGNIYWTRTSPGQYIGNSNNLFPVGKTAIFITPGQPGYPAYAAAVDMVVSDEVYVYTLGLPSGAPDNNEDEKLFYTTVEIRVYN